MNSIRSSGSSRKYIGSLFGTLGYDSADAPTAAAEDKSLLVVLRRLVCLLEKKGGQTNRN